MSTDTTYGKKSILSRERRLADIYDAQTTDPNFAHLRYQNHFVAGFGSTDAKVVFVRATPSAIDLKVRKAMYQMHDPLYGRLLSTVGLDFDSAYFTALLKYRPQSGRDPRIGEIVYSREYLFREIQVIRPSVVVTMGAAASLPFIDGDDWPTARASTYLKSGIPVVPVPRPEQCHSSSHMTDDLLRSFERVKEFL